jgi:hypothetical protein
MKKASLFLSILLLTGNSFSNIHADSKIQPLKKSIEIGNAKKIKTDITFFSGELVINNTTDKLAECSYGYNKDFLEPEMTYNETNQTGYLAINSKNAEKGIDIDDVSKSNKWNLNLNKNIENAVSIKLKAGKANIDMEGCLLSSFDYKMSAGESHVNLRNTSVPQMNFNLLAGESDIDLSGNIKNDIVAEIKGGIGNITVKVPYDTGVKITVSGVLGNIQIPFFNKDGKIYTNDMYGKTKNTLYLNIKRGIGQITVKMEK